MCQCSDGKRSSFSLFRPPSRFTGSPRAAASRQPSSKSPHPAAPLERLGTAFVIPTEPASIYEHTIMARPNFENRQPPASNYMFLSGEAQFISNSMPVQLMVLCCIQQVRGSMRAKANRWLHPAFWMQSFKWPKDMSNLCLVPLLPLSSPPDGDRWRL